MLASMSEFYMFPLSYMLHLSAPTFSTAPGFLFKYSCVCMYICIWSESRKSGILLTLEKEGSLLLILGCNTTLLTLVHSLSSVALLGLRFCLIKVPVVLPLKRTEFYKVSSSLQLARVTWMHVAVARKSWNVRPTKLCENHKNVELILAKLGKRARIYF